MEWVDGETRNSVSVEAGGLVVITLRGKQTGDSIRAVSEESIRLAAQGTSHGPVVGTLTDVRGLKLNDITSEARMMSRKYMQVQTARSAIVGGRGVMGLISYLQRLSGTKNGRMFTNPREARAWLLGHGRNKGVGKSAASLISGTLIVAIGISALVGWHTGNAYLTSWLPHLRPINPMAAVGLIIGGAGFIAYWFKKPTLLKVTGALGALLGVAALLLPIDELLYGEKLRALGGHTQLADSAALCFIAWGLSPFTVKLRASLRLPLQYLCGAVLLGLGMFSMFGQLYAHDFMYGISPSFVMAFNLAAAFTVAGVAMALLVIYRKLGHGILGQVSRVGWLLVAALVMVQAATYGAWAQSVGRNTTKSQQDFSQQTDSVRIALEERLTAYLDALQGFGGLFAASEVVDQGEFEAYYDKLDLGGHYPGIRALSYISRVPEKDLPAFVQQRKADKSLHPAGNPSFAITGKAVAPVHYILTYVADSPNPGGSDLASQPSRLQALIRAEEAGEAVSSGTIEFAATATTPAEKGFFITVPVHNKGAKNVTGFVNAVFNYDDFFARAFTNQQLRNQSLSIVDAIDGTETYRAGAKPFSGEEALSDVMNVPVADRRWNIISTASPTFGLTGSQTALPRAILIGGQLFAALLIVVFVVLMRSRRQGYDLADRITEDLQNERNLAVANDQKSQAILSSIGDAVFAIDTNRRIQLFNPAAQRTSGYTEEEVLGKPYEEILHFEFEKTGKINRSFISTALAGKLATMAGSTVLIRKDGSRVAVADSAAPIRDNSGRIIGAIVVFRDVSKEVELDRAKTEFVSLASHQLRTPLSAINWYSELLLGGDAGKLSKDQNEYVREIFEGNQRMIELVNSLLDVSRLEVGKMPTKPEPTSINMLIDSLEKELKTSITTKRLKFQKDLVKLPDVTADPKQLRMVVQNLMSNAVKYTPDKGEVHVTLRKAKPEDIHAASLKLSDGPYWFFSVKDTGYGIPKGQQPKIFGKLFRADNVRAMDVEGTGLGLYIVKEVVEKMGGRVWFDSIESVGTTFSVVLPMTAKGKHNG
jgi:PAS domain S-box-containing protein